MWANAFRPVACPVGCAFVVDGVGSALVERYDVVDYICAGVEVGKGVVDGESAYPAGWPVAGDDAAVTVSDGCVALHTIVRYLRVVCGIMWGLHLTRMAIAFTSALAVAGCSSVTMAESAPTTSSVSTKPSHTTPEPSPVEQLPAETKGPDLALWERSNGIDTAPWRSHVTSVEVKVQQLTVGLH